MCHTTWVVFYFFDFSLPSFTLQIKVYEDLSETLKSLGNLDKFNDIVEKIKNLQEECSEEDEFEEQSESSSIELNQDELLALESGKRYVLFKQCVHSVRDCFVCLKLGRM